MSQDNLNVDKESTKVFPNDDLFKFKNNGTDDSLMQHGITSTEVLNVEQVSDSNKTKDLNGSGGNGSQKFTRAGQVNASNRNESEQVPQGSKVKAFNNESNAEVFDEPLVHKSNNVHGQDGRGDDSCTQVPQSKQDIEPKKPEDPDSGGIHSQRANILHNPGKSNLKNWRIPKIDRKSLYQNYLWSGKSEYARATF